MTPPELRDAGSEVYRPEPEAARREWFLTIAAVCFAGAAVALSLLLLS